MQVRLPEESVDVLAKAMHFTFCDEMGWPNGQPRWNEMPDQSERRLAADTMAKSLWRSLARAALDAHYQIVCEGAVSLKSKLDKAEP